MTTQTEERTGYAVAAEGGQGLLLTVLVMVVLGVLGMWLISA